MKKLSYIMIATSFICILGTAGSSDLETISLAQTFAQIAIGLAIGGIGVLIGKIAE